MNFSSLNRKNLAILEEKRAQAKAKGQKKRTSQTPLQRGWTSYRPTGRSFGPPDPDDPVYEGMIVGISSKAGDLEINVMKGKKLTNMRTQNTDENVVLTPVRKMAIAEQLSLLNTDEALEITPKSCRLRKLILDPHERKRLSRAKSKAS